MQHTKTYVPIHGADVHVRPPHIEPAQKVVALVAPNVDQELAIRIWVELLKGLKPSVLGSVGAIEICAIGGKGKGQYET